MPCLDINEYFCVPKSKKFGIKGLSSVKMRNMAFCYLFPITNRELNSKVAQIKRRSPLPKFALAVGSKINCTRQHFTSFIGFVKVTLTLLFRCFDFQLFTIVILTVVKLLIPSISSTCLLRLHVRILRKI